MTPELEDLKPAERRALARLMGASFALGATIAGVLTLSNEVVQGGASPWWGALAGALVLGMAGINYLLTPKLTGELIDTFTARRVALIARLRATPLRTLETTPEVESQLARDWMQVEQLPGLLAAGGFLGSAVLVSTLYLFSLSAAAGLLWLGIVAGLVQLQRRVRQGLMAAFPQRARAHGGLTRALRQRVDGFAQLLFDGRARAASGQLLAELEAATTRAQAQLDEAQGRSVAWGEDAVTLALAAVLFSLSGFVHLDAATLYRVTTTVLAISGFTLVVILIMVQAQLGFAALGRLQALERRLGTPERTPVGDPVLPPGAALKLSVSRLGYAYGEGGFSVGPVDLELHGGQLVIIRGGNGCGKTTLMKTLAGLYAPTQGSLRLGGRPIGPADLAWYRAHVTAIFTGQHLFERPYGLDASEEEINALLERFGLGEVTQVREGRFTRTKLSSGQSKRLAMVVALLEERPIVLLDEWDSHQDPGLRRFYYEELLPELRAQGKLLIVVSHDARRFGLADVLLHLEGGRVVPEPRSPA
ncbi:MAG: ATP-binding cassette domain-containing protein [Alphaproteobacteria bacterium]|nr:ATP-binding cassette domain-containing protein [Alphaproteobacteria bacterium]